MDLFHIIEDAEIVLRRKGVFHQCKVYRRGRHVYAGWGKGFVRLIPGGTTVPDLTWEELPDHPAIVWSRLTIDFVPKITPVRG